MKMINKSARLMLIFSIIGLSVVLVGILSFINLQQFSKNMDMGLQQMLIARGGEISEKCDNRLNEVAGKTESLALIVSAMPDDNLDFIMQFMPDLVKSDPIIFGSGLWFAPDAYPGQKYFGPYFLKGNSQAVTLTMDYSTEEYRYTQFPWYTHSIQGNREVFWDEPAFDTVSKAAMLTSSAPIIRDGRPVGVVTVDIGMQELDDYIRSIQIGKHGFAFLVTQSGYFIAYQDEENNLRKRIQDSADPAMAALGKSILEASGTLFTESAAFGEASYVMATPIGNSHLKLVLAVPKSDYDEPTHRAVAASAAVSLLAVFLLCAMLWGIFRRIADLDDDKEKAEAVKADSKGE